MIRILIQHKALEIFLGVSESAEIWEMSGFGFVWGPGTDRFGLLVFTTFGDGKNVAGGT